MSDITALAALQMDAKANNLIRKCLGHQRYRSNVALFGNTTLTLPLKSISPGYKQTKVRLVFKLRDSPDPTLGMPGSRLKQDIIGMQFKWWTEPLAS